MESMLLLTCSVLIGVVNGGVASPYELTPNLAEFYCVFNGVYNNRQQVEQGTTGLTLMEEHVRYLYIPALSPNPVLYFELTDGNVLVMAHVGILTEDKEGHIHMEPFNFTDISNVKPGSIDENVIRSLTRDKLYEQPGCGVVFVKVYNHVFNGVWPECKHTNSGGKHRYYKATITCDGFIAAIPPGASEKTALEPYSVKSTGKRYPLEAAPSSYVCDCESTGD